MNGERVPLVVIGAGPVGLAAALDAAVRGLPVVALEERSGESAGSRAICWSQRTLDILDRLGCGERVAARGVTWRRGRVFWRERELYAFDLQPQSGERRPAFVNLQQNIFERLLVERARELGVDLRLGHRVAEIGAGEDGVVLEVASEDGARYRLAADWAIAADGARSKTRHALGLATMGQAFDDRFLIVDVRMHSDFPSERWFWFEPPFHAGGSALLHRQADSVFRLDFQLGPHADAQRELEPARIERRVRAMLGEKAAFDLAWASVYTFRGVMLERFRAGRVFFAGDSAHLMSPFGARGANSGVQDVDNLVWKLAMVHRGEALPRLLDSYDRERVPAARENLQHTGRSTEFIAPKGHGNRVLRDAVLELAVQEEMARALVNSGRLSRSHVYRESPLVTPDRARWEGGVVPGAACVDAPLAGERGGFLLERLAAPLCRGFVVLRFGEGTVRVEEGPKGACSTLADDAGVVRARYGATPGCWVLVRPDQHVAARGREDSPGDLSAALRRSSGHDLPV